MKLERLKTPNPQQQRAIQTKEGPLLIIAGPGSGKTFTLVERVLYLIVEKGVLPENLFVATFTEKAAQELVTRVSDHLISNNIQVNLNEMYLGTFHSICLRFLKEYREFTRLKRNFTIMDQFDQQYFLYQHLRDYQEIDNSELILGNPTLWWKRSESLLNWVNKVSEETLELEDLLSASDERVQVLGKCYALYQKHLEEENALDFSTIQVEALHLFENNPEVLAEIRDKIKYLMVDEYQDTNTIQEAILFKLAGPSQNICVVGDDDQGLYRFRGATIRNILEFPDNFQERVCKQEKLTKNYRSHPEIIDFYNQWMDCLDWVDNGRKFRFDKTISPSKKSTGMPTVLKVSSSGSPENWHDEVLAFLRELKSSKAITDLNQVAFLFRSVKNRRVIALAQALEENGIPVYSPRSNFYISSGEETAEHLLAKEKG